MAALNSATWARSRGLRLFDEQGDALVCGDEHLVGVCSRRNGQVHGVEFLFLEHLVVVRIGRMRLIDGRLFLEGFLAFVAECLEDDLAFLGEGS